MSRLRPVALVAATLALATGCGSSDTQKKGEPTPGTQGQTVELIGADWELAPGEETYRCVRQTTDRDLLIQEFIPTVPKGTHHTVVSLDVDSQPDGVVDCSSNPFEGTGANLIYGTGAGSVPMKFPEGVATKIPAGTQVFMNLHLYNVDTTPLTGRSEVRVVTAAPEAIQHEASEELLGPNLGLEVVPGKSTVDYKCQALGAATAVIAQPHMHTLGTHFYAAVLPQGGGSPQVMLDVPYDFDAQVHKLQDPLIPIAAGDEINVKCSYDNPSNETVYFGESTQNEMCLVALFYYPAKALRCY